MGLLILIILILLLLGAVPSWPYSRGWGYGPSGLIGAILIIILILLLFGALPWGFGPRVVAAETAPCEVQGNIKQSDEPPLANKGPCGPECACCPCLCNPCCCNCCDNRMSEDQSGDKNAKGKEQGEDGAHR